MADIFAGPNPPGGHTDHLLPTVSTSPTNALALLNLSPSSLLVDHSPSTRRPTRSRMSISTPAPGENASPDTESAASLPVTLTLVSPAMSCAKGRTLFGDP